MICTLYTSIHHRVAIVVAVVVAIIVIVVVVVATTTTTKSGCLPDSRTRSHICTHNDAKYAGKSTLSVGLTLRMMKQAR